MPRELQISLNKQGSCRWKGGKKEVLPLGVYQLRKDCGEVTKKKKRDWTSPSPRLTGSRGNLKTASGTCLEEKGELVRGTEKRSYH